MATSQRMVLREDVVDEESLGEDKLSDGENTRPSRDDNDELESGDNPVLDDGGDDLDAYLATEVSSQSDAYYITINNYLPLLRAELH